MVDLACKIGLHFFVHLSAFIFAKARYTANSRIVNSFVILFTTNVRSNQTCFLVVLSDRQHTRTGIKENFGHIGSDDFNLAF